MARKAKLIRMINVRTSNAFATRFKAKARRQGKIAEVHRELLEAFVEDRVTITPKS